MDSGRAQREALLLAAGTMILAVVVIVMAWFFRPVSSTPSTITSQNQTASLPHGPFGLEPPTVTITAGSTAEVQVVLQTNTQPIEAFDLVARYNPQQIRIDNISTDGSPFGFYPRSTAEAGTILISGNSYGQNPSSFTVDGAIATLRITALESLNLSPIFTIVEDESKAFSNGKKI